MNKYIFLLFLISTVVASESESSDIDDDYYDTSDSIEEPASIHFLDEGNRVDGDELLQTTAYNDNLGLPISLTLFVKYPKPGLKPKTLTYIKGLVTFIGQTGDIKVTAGGIGQQIAMVTMTSPKASGYSYNVQFYGK